MLAARNRCSAQGQSVWSCAVSTGMAGIPLLALLLSISGSRLEAQVPPTGPRSENLLVLSSGRVIEGIIEPSAGGYTVKLPTGQMYVPFDQVRFEADDRSDAYRKLRASMPDLTANNHLALARWCIAHHQYHSARTELLDAISLEPNREEPRQMLKRLEVIMHPEDVYRPIQDAPEVTKDGFESYEVQSLAGMSRELAREYTTRIQPLLLNKCGNARCHGGNAPQEFNLVQRSRTSRIVAERNLAAIAAYIDKEAPADSPLLRIPLGNHGNGGRTVFFGLSGQKQLDDLRQFVIEYSQEQQALHETQQQRAERIAQRQAARSRTSSGSLPSPDTGSGQSPLPADHTGIVQAAAPSSNREGSPHRSIEDGRKLIEQVLREERNDPFSPDAFNQRNSSAAPLSPLPSPSQGPQP